MSTEAELSPADALAAVAALQSQLGQARADLLLAQADAETLATLLIDWAASDGTSGFMDADERLAEMAHALAAGAREHPGTALRDEVAAARAEIAFLRSWLRGELTISDAEIDAMRAEIAETEAAFDTAVKAGGA